MRIHYLLRISRAAMFLLLLSAATVHADEILFWDDFKSGSADNWELVYGYEYEVADEALCLLTS
ncbi:MAG: hypothetical protein ABIJ61_07615 [bacterium]